MKKSNDIIKVSLKDKVIIFSTISRTTIELTKEEYLEFENEKFNSPKFLTKKAIALLKDNYFILDDYLNSKLLKNYLLQKDRLNQEMFSSYVVFSTQCNFSCLYCYEKGLANSKVMNDDTLTAVLEWYDNIIKKNRYKKCMVILFGGEPLLHDDLIRKFVKKIKNIINKNNSDLIIRIVTNGYLLNNGIVSFLAKYGLDEIQLTLDGVGKIHDRRRPLKNGAPTFYTIINNIKAIKKFDIRLLIRISFDKDNINEIEELLEYLSKINTNNQIEIYFAPIHQTYSQINRKSSYCLNNIPEQKKEIIQMYKKLYSKAQKNGFSIPDYYTNGPCMILSNDSVLIDSNGDLYKCVEMIGINELCIGNVRDKNYNGKYYEFVSMPSFSRCVEKNCKYILMCGGGCKIQSYLKTNAINKNNCEKQFIKELTKYLIKLKYGGKNNE